MYHGPVPTPPRFSERPPRVRTGLAARCAIDGGEVPARLVDVSVGGAFVEEAYPPAHGSRVRLVLPLPDGQPPLSLAAEVVRSGAALRLVPGAAMERLCVRVGGMGVRFLELDDDALRRLARYVGSLSDD